jgi:hypothetical protein
MRAWLVRKLLEWLQEPIRDYEQRVWNDPHALRRNIRKGDVVLVEGDLRISAIIKYLTQSSWSHSALYIGDELLRRGGAAAARARTEFGAEAEWLIVEALPQGVVASPLAKYIDYNLRIARPHRLRREHLQTVLDEAIAAIGWRYDLRNVFDLLRYLLPARIVPDRFRRAALHFGSGQPTEVICSSLLGALFARVRFPVLPQVEFPEGSEPSSRRGGFLSRVLGHEADHYTGLFRMRHPTLLTPRDFDLSPYFEIVKYNVIEDGEFDYQRIQWAEAEPQLPSERARG